MVDTVTDFISLIKDIRGNQFDAEGLPTNGKWKDIKDWDTAVTANATQVGVDAAQVTSDKDSVAASAISVANSETAVTTSETAAALSETNAATSEGNASTSETNAASSESASSISAAASEVSKLGSDSAFAAVVVERDATIDNSLNAEDWVNRPVDDFVREFTDGNPTIRPGNLGSALHHATKASDSAIAASTSETNAALSESGVTASALSAANAATAALVSETNAATDETLAEQHKDSAIVSANTATLKADESASSAVLSANSATASSTSAAEALASKNAGDVSEANAATSETNSAASAVTSGNSATASASSATESDTTATASAASAASAVTAKDLAITAQTASEAARDFSQKWAKEDEDVLISDGVHTDDYSAYHYSRKAAAVVGGITDFTDLADVPVAYTGNSGQYLRVKGAEDGLEFDELTKVDVGLSAVDNTSDDAKPISTATADALATKATSNEMTSANAAITVIDDRTAGITAEVAGGSDPIRLVVDKAFYTDNVQSVGTIQGQELVTYALLSSINSTETIGAY